MTVDPPSVIAPLACPSHTWHRTTSQTLVPGYRLQLTTRSDHARAVAAAMVTLAAGLNKAA